VSSCSFIPPISSPLEVEAKQGHHYPAGSIDRS
jgi:hypothetical protein